MSHPRAAHYQAVIDGYQAVRRLPTLVAAVSESGEVTWAGCAGAAVDLDTQFRIGSITKTMTAVLVMQCRDEGLLDLDDAVGRWLPESAHRDVTVRALLSHTAGLSSEPAGEWWERTPGVDAARMLADNVTTVADPREFFHYSNLGFGLLGEVVARIRGTAWAKVLQSRLLEPLGLTRTTYLPQAPAASGWSVHPLTGVLSAEPATDTVALAPAGQMWSTVADLARYVEFLRSGHPDVLAVSTLREMATPDTVARDMGLGLRLWGEGEGQMVGHLGSMPGFQATAFVEPHSGLGVVALTNGTTGFAGFELTDRLLGPTTPGPVEPWVPTVEVPDWARELVGHWHWGNSAYEVRWHNELLEFHDVARMGLAEQFVLRDGAIVGVNGYHKAEQLHVVRDEDGRINHLNCATFIYTREPYDPRAPIPGGVPA